MRLDRLLANMGYGSRKEVKKLLKESAVTVDGEVVKDGKVHVNPKEQTIFVYQEEVNYQPYIYLMMNKPKDVICATDDEVHVTVIDLLDEKYQKYRPFPVGRLDKDTTGLLLITNDGAFSHEMMSPKKEVPKTYIAQVQGKVTEEDVKKFQDGVTLDDGYMTKPAKLEILRSGAVSFVRVTLTEGKFHQVKRMFQAVGKRVLELKRIQIGGLCLDENLREGEYKELSEEEMLLLKEKNHS